MKKSLMCEDLGIPDCTFEVQSEKNDEMIDAMFNHVQKYHPEMVLGFSEQDEAAMTEKMEKMIE